MKGLARLLVVTTNTEHGGAALRHAMHFAATIGSSVYVLVLAGQNLLPESGTQTDEIYEQRAKNYFRRIVERIANIAIVDMRRVNIIWESATPPSLEDYITKLKPEMTLKDYELKLISPSHPLGDIDLELICRSSIHTYLAPKVCWNASPKNIYAIVGLEERRKSLEDDEQCIRHSIQLALNLESQVYIVHAFDSRCISGILTANRLELRGGLMSDYQEAARIRLLDIAKRCSLSSSSCYLIECKKGGALAVLAAKTHPRSGAIIVITRESKKTLSMWTGPSGTPVDLSASGYGILCIGKYSSETRKRAGINSTK